MQIQPTDDAFCRIGVIRSACRSSRSCRLLRQIAGIAFHVYTNGVQILVELDLLILRVPSFLLHGDSP